MKVNIAILLPIRTTMNEYRTIMADMVLPAIPRIGETVVVSGQTITKLKSLSLDPEVFSKKQVAENKKGWEKLTQDTQGDIFTWDVVHIEYNEELYEVILVCKSGYQNEEEENTTKTNSNWN